MVNKPAIVKHKKSMLTRSILTALFLSTTASAECIMQEKSVNTFNGSVDAIDNIKRDIVPSGNELKCTVRFRAKVNNEWHTAVGEHSYTYGSQQGCGVAMQKAEQDLLSRLANNHIQSQQIMVCHDDDSQMNLHQTDIGTVGNLSQYRLHPNYPESFGYNGTECRWFLDSEFVEKDILTYEGIICKIGNSNQWSVIDKF